MGKWYWTSGFHTPWSYLGELRGLLLRERDRSRYRIERLLLKFEQHAGSVNMFVWFLWMRWWEFIHVSSWIRIVTENNGYVSMCHTLSCTCSSPEHVKQGFVSFWFLLHSVNCYYKANLNQKIGFNRSIHAVVIPSSYLVGSRGDGLITRHSVPSRKSV